MTFNQAEQTGQRKGGLSNPIRVLHSTFSLFLK